MPRIPYLAGFLVLPMFSLATLSCRLFLRHVIQDRAIILHGPHHSAQ